MTERPDLPRHAELGRGLPRVMRKQLDRYLSLIGSDSLDVATLYYVEEESEWKEIVQPGGAPHGSAAFVTNIIRAPGRSQLVLNYSQRGFSKIP